MSAEQQLERLIKAYDAFTESDFSCTMDNPAWMKLSNEFHKARIYLNNKTLSVISSSNVKVIDRNG